MKDVHYTWLAIGAVIIGFLGMFLIITSYSPIDTREIPVTFKVVEGKVGLLKEDRFLHFGHVTQNGGSTRRILISHENDISYRVYLRGPVAEYISINPWQGDIFAGETQNVTFTLSVPANMTLGEYNGTAHVEIFAR